MKNIKLNKRLISVLLAFAAFAIPGFVMAFAYYCNGIYPGSDLTLLIYDMDAQYVSFFGYLHNIGEGYNNLMYQTLSGMGGSFFGTWAYYLASPLSLIVLLFDKSNLPDAIYLITLIKISLCGLSFYIYSIKGRLNCCNRVIALICSCSYALIGFNMIYAMNLMWIDGVIMLPLVMLGADLLFEKNKPLVFIASLSFAIIFNYYTAYMIVLYVIIYYFYVCYSYRIGLKKSIKIGFVFLISGLLSLMISCVVWLPVILDLRYGKLSEGSKGLSGFIRTSFSVLRQLFPGSYGGLIANDAPPIYCGLAVLGFFIAFFSFKEVNIRKKIAVVIISALFMMSLCWDRIDVIFHGFRIPDCYPARYSFLICFFLISTALESFPIVLSKFFFNKKSIALALLAMIVFIDMAYNATFTISSLNSDAETGGYVERFFYDYYYLQSEYLINNTDIEGSRSSTDVDFNFNDGLLFGIPSIDYFSSSYNLGMAEFLRSMGLDVVYNVIRDQGLCPLSASLLNIKYYYQHFGDSEIPYFVDYYNRDSESGIYINPYTSGLGVVVYNSDADFNTFNYNAFDNLNSFTFSLTGVDCVFVDSANHEEFNCYVDENGYFIKTYQVEPLENSHLYFYVSPANYYESSDLLCDEELYLGDRVVATYKNVGDRYIVDLGISDGTPLKFTLRSDSDLCEAYFYSFDDDLYYSSMDELNRRKLSNVTYSSEGVAAEFDSENEGEVLLLLPYEKGYDIFIDGVDTQYESFNDCLIRFSIPAGHHNLTVKYTTPGLQVGFLISMAGLLICAIFVFFIDHKRKRQKSYDFDKLFFTCSVDSVKPVEGLKHRFNISNKVITYLLSFLIPVFSAFIAFYNQEIYIGGTNTALIYDLRGQILPLYGYLSNLGKGYNTLMHSMSGGLGGNFWGDFTYYYSPLDLIYVFAKPENLPDLIYALLLFRIGLCGFFSSAFCYSKIVTKHKSLFTVLLSCCYALMSYNFVYSMLPMWFDCVMLLPLLALCVDSIVAGKRSKAFIMLFSLCIVSNFYIAYMNAIALFLYFVFRCVEEKYSFKFLFRRAVVFFLHGVISAGICSVLLIPSILDFSRGRLAEGSIENANLFIKNNIFGVLRSSFPMSYNALDSNQPPYIFCGSIIVVLALIWMLDRSVALRTKLTGAGLIVVYYLSYIFGPLDRAWHGFSDPVGFSCRYSYTYVFILIVFSIKSINYLNVKSFNISRSLKVFGLYTASLYTFIELTLNASFIISGLFYDYNYSNRDEYRRYSTVVLNGLSFLDSNQEEYSRLVKNFSYSVFDGALYGYDGLQLFSSSYNSSVIDFLQSVGLDSYNSTLQETGITPPVADVLNVGHYYSYWFDKSGCYDEVYSQGTYHLYENSNVLPLGIFLKNNNNAKSEFVSNNPFDNINTIFSDISCFYENDVFKPQDYQVVGRSMDENSMSSTGEVFSIEFTPEQSGYYYVYRSYEMDDGSFGSGDTAPAYIPYLYYYVDDEALGTYGYNHHRYIGELGQLNAGQTYKISLDDQDFARGDIYLYFYDHDLCTQICDSANGLKVSEIGKSGITLSGKMDIDSDAMISLPYESGYLVTVNGQVASYDSYRNALMLLHLGAGENIVQIKYVPNGLVLGAFMSFVFVIVLIFMMIADVRGMKARNRIQDE